MAFEWLRERLARKQEEVQFRKNNKPNIMPIEVLPPVCPFCEQAEWAEARLRWSPTFERWTVVGVCKNCGCVSEIVV